MDASCGSRVVNLTRIHGSIHTVAWLLYLGFCGARPCQRAKRGALPGGPRRFLDVPGDSWRCPETWVTKMHSDCLILILWVLGVRSAVRTLSDESAAHGRLTDRHYLFDWVRRFWVKWRETFCWEASELGWIFLDKRDQCCRRWTPWCCNTRCAGCAPTRSGCTPCSGASYLAITPLRSAYHSSALHPSSSGAHVLAQHVVPAFALLQDLEFDLRCDSQCLPELALLTSSTSTRLEHKYILNAVELLKTNHMYRDYRVIDSLRCCIEVFPLHWCREQGCQSCRSATSIGIYLLAALVEGNSWIFCGLVQMGHGRRHHGQIQGQQAQLVWRDFYFYLVEIWFFALECHVWASRQSSRVWAVIDV